MRTGSFVGRIDRHLVAQPKLTVAGALHRASLRGLLILIAGWAVAACSPRQTDVRLEPPLVVVTTAKPADQTERAFTGVVSARVQGDLGFRVSGKLVERLVDTGMIVRAGQPLMRIDRTDFALAVAAQDQAVRAARARSEQASADEARYRSLLGSGAISRQSYDQAKAAADSARAELSAAVAQAAVTTNQGDYSVLKSDADGVVVETLAEPGQVVSAGQVVIRLAHDGPREATVFLPEGVRPQVGSVAKATLYNSNTDTSPARLRQLSDAADLQTRTYDARYVLEGDAARAPLGATVTIHIASQESSGLLEVPAGAIYDNGKGPGVWLIDGRASSVNFQPVRIRGLGIETALLSNGVTARERIVALGAWQLHQGEKVRIAETRNIAQ
jgi:RND family efflux transporter MFP subunit